MVQKLHFCEKVYFNQLLDFTILFFIIPSLFIIVSLDTEFFQYHQGVKQFGSRSGPMFCRAWSGSKLFAKVFSRWQKLPLAGKALNTYYSLAKTLAKVNFIWLLFHLAKVLATTNSELGKPWRCTRRLKEKYQNKHKTTTTTAKTWSGPRWMLYCLLWTFLES